MQCQQRMIYQTLYKKLDEKKNSNSNVYKYEERIRFEEELAETLQLYRLEGKRIKLNKNLYHQKKMKDKSEPVCLQNKQIFHQLSTGYLCICE